MLNEDQYLVTQAPKISNQSERRESFRVFQDVLFDFHVVEAFAADNSEPEEEFSDSISLSLLNELHKLDKHNNELLKLFGDKNRLLGDYLRGINQKMDLVTRHVLFAKDNPNQQNKQRLNLSETGVAFLSDRMLYKDSFIALRLIFLPTYVPVMTFAKVTRCDAKNESYQAAARFHRLKDDQRQELARRILKTQVSTKKNQTKQGIRGK